MHVQELFNLAVSSKTIKHVQLTLQKAIDNEQKIEKEFSRQSLTSQCQLMQLPEMT